MNYYYAGFSPGLKLAAAILLFCGLTLSDLRYPGYAQVSSDSTMKGERSLIRRNSGRRRVVIEGGARRDTNLFHSFRDFNVTRGERVYFANPDGVNNIISRVTGRERSTIEGKLGVLGNANLFLINPNGIIFGRGASLDLQGSFVASTANSISFPENGEFSATNPQEPSLTLNVPLGLQFRGSRGEVQARDGANLQVNQGSTLALVGNRLVLDDATLIGGQIELGSLVGRGLVRFDLDGANIGLSYNGIDNSQVMSRVGQTRQNSQGDIVLRNGARVSTSTFDSLNGGNLSVRAFGNLTLSGGNTELFTKVDPNSTARGGNLRIFVRNLTVNDGARVYVNTDAGNAGNLVIRAREAVEVDGIGSQIAANVGSRATGRGGNLGIQARDVIVEDGGRISASTLGPGNAGDLEIRAFNSVAVTAPDDEFLGFSIDNSSKIRFLPILSEIVSRSGTESSNNKEELGNSGNLTISTQELEAENAQISTTTYGGGNPGRLFIRASESVWLTSSGLYSRVDRRAPGRASGDNRDLIIRTRDLLLEDGSTINISDERRNGETSSGDVRISARRIELRGSYIIADSGSTGGGNIFIGNTDDDPNLPELERLVLRRDEERRGDTLLRRDSRISASAAREGDGGNIEIDSDFILAVPRDNSDILANAEQGAGGRVQIRSQAIFGIQPQERLTENSDITAFSAGDIQGQIVINGPSFDDPTRDLIELPEEVVDVSNLIAEGCAARNQSRSRFVIGRRTLPSERGENNSVREAQGWKKDGNWISLTDNPSEIEPNQLIPYSPWSSQSDCERSHD